MRFEPTVVPFGGQIRGGDAGPALGRGRATREASTCASRLKVAGLSHGMAGFSFQGDIITESGHRARFFLFFLGTECKRD